MENGFKKTAVKIFLADKFHRPAGIPDERPQHPADLAAQQQISRQPRQQNISRRGRAAGPETEQRRHAKIAQDARQRNKKRPVAAVIMGR